MATRGIYLTRNNQRKLFPCTEIDMGAMISASALESISVNLNGTTATGYKGYFKTANAAWFTDSIKNPRSDDQFIYFNADRIWDCYERRELTSTPDDFFITGIETPPTPRNANATYYVITSTKPTTRQTMGLPQSYNHGTYYYNNSMCCICKTDNDYYFGGAINNVYSRSYDYYQLDLWYLWYNTNDGLIETFNTYPQYGLQNPPVTSVPFERVYWLSPTIPDDDKDNPETPTTVICEFVVGDYNGSTYAGICFHEITDDGTPTGLLHTLLLPEEFFGEIVPYEEPEPGPDVPDPGDFGPDSTPDAGGSGTYTDTNDSPGLPDTTPLVGSTWSHGIHVYRVGDTEYNNLLAALWGLGDGGIGDTLWQRYQNYRCSPLSGILSSHYIPYHLGAVPPILPTTQAIRCAGTTIPDTTSWIVNDCYISTYTVGTLSVPEYFGSALDYSPYTVMRLFLPFCGWLDVDPDRVVGGSITVKYVTDNITGDCTAFVQCTDRTGSVTSMYTASGNCAVQLPVTGNDQGFGTMLNAASSALMSAASGNVLGIASSAASLLSARKQMSQAGSYSGTTALTGDHQCRLQIIRPVQSTPKYGQQLRGRPSDIGCLIGDLIGTGWSSFDAVHADIEGATVDECREIERLLHEGVIL
jgi:hypothetical protein